jgi:hypothetical protein
MPLAGFKTHDPSKRAAADPSLRPCGHWDQNKSLHTKKSSTGYKKCLFKYFLKTSLNFAFLFLRITKVGGKLLKILTTE